MRHAQRNNIIRGAGMTDHKGDRSKRPHEPADPDMFLHVTKRTAAGVYVTGAKAHMTGGLNSHRLCVMPAHNMGAADRELAFGGLVPGGARGLNYTYAPHSCAPSGPAQGVRDRDQRRA